MAETAVAAPATHSQPSRKGKKAWRKNVDISEVQTGLEDVRDEIIKGGVISEKQANELFATDVTGDAEIARQQSGKKLLKSEEILAQRSVVPGLDGRKRKVADVVVVPGSSKRQKNGVYVTHKELQRLRRIGGAVAVEEPGATHDPWNAVAVEKDPRLDFLDDVQPKREPKTLKEAPIPLSANGKRIPDIRKPDAGKSYNPLVDDWSALLAREGAAAVSAEQARLAAEAVMEEKEARALAEAAIVEQQEKDEYATDYESAWESEWEGIQSGAEDKTEVHVQKLQKRKTPAERNKIKARKEREARGKWERKQKVREAEEKRIKQIAKEMSVRDRARMAARSVVDDSSDSEGEARHADVVMQRRRFGKLAIPDAPLEVVLPDELQDSLRRLKPEGNLLTDRYRNLLVNGKVEVRRRRDKETWRVKKVDRTEKWSYKDWKLK
ncbi:hypothetical protein LTR36_010990 [Oleoguttula mirabilis]|uniref:Ribosome biogenesis protein NOP53 n=1 Tax=Oleoguttula mirabilis TaxID=1507867 RepID=A0AAV9J426_9PEZI|nr:hypothetical protein LTR36_010990 [Oleoguttula mirabilis]